MADKKFLNQIELSRRWKISERTLESWRIRSEGPPFYKIGNRIRYAIEDIEIYEAENISN